MGRIGQNIWGEWKGWDGVSTGASVIGQNYFVNGWDLSELVWEWAGSVRISQSSRIGQKNFVCGIDGIFMPFGFLV